MPHDAAPSLWKFGGLGPVRLVKLVVHKISEDELSTRSSSLSYYFLLALFPLLLFLVSLLAVFAGPGTQLQEHIISGLGRLAPGSASAVVEKVVHQTFQSSSGIKLAAGILGALWAASGGVSAVVVSLNKIYQVTERRPWWKQKLVIVSLTLAISALIIVAITLALYGGKIGQAIFSHVGAGNIFAIIWKVLQWPVALGAMFVAFAMMYYFAPDLDERTWYWVSPGSVAGVMIWLLASIGFRYYLHFFNSYSKTYGSLGAVIILILWLYITGFAILIGGEVNWVIESQDKKMLAFERKKQEIAAEPEVA
jgi:membrane protein